MVEVGESADTVPGMDVANGKDAAAEAPFERDKDASVYLRIMLAAGEIGQLDKDGTVKIGQGGGYDYITHDNVTMHAKRALLKHGVMVIPTVTDHSKDGNRTELKVRVRFVNVDKSDDWFEVDGIGYGVDNSDKGPGKAYSYAMKYIYMKVLMLNSADDIEQEGTEHQPGVSQAALAAEATNAKEALQMWAAALKHALGGAQSVADLDAVWKENRKRLNGDDVPEVTFNFMSDLYSSRREELSE